PDTTIQNGPDGPTNATAATFTLSSENGAAFTCTLARPDGTATGPASCGPTVTYDVPQEGDYTFTAFATDAAGNDGTPAALTRTQLLPLGSTVDTRRGSVTLLAAPRAHAAAQKAVFAEGVFRVTQPGTTTLLTLTEALAPCGKRVAGKPRTRKLSGKGSG